MRVSCQTHKQAILWLQADGGHEPAAIAFDLEYAAKVAQGIYPKGLVLG